ncbi:MAG: hypothetical protein JWQ73_4041 [Variovorax sp.]|nr:hypothetical protein [Variovorax sp.]
MRSDADFEKGLSKLLVATGEHRQPLVDEAVNRLLRLIRDDLHMDVAFVAEFVDGHRVFRYVDAGPGGDMVLPGMSNPLEDSLCQRVIDGRIAGVINDVPHLRKTKTLPDFPIAIGAHIGVPVQRLDGSIYGTLCCFNFEPDSALGERHIKRLEMSARLAGRLLDETEGGGTTRPAAD